MLLRRKYLRRPGPIRAAKSEWSARAESHSLPTKRKTEVGFSGLGVEECSRFVCKGFSACCLTRGQLNDAAKAFFVALRSKPLGRASGFFLQLRHGNHLQGILQVNRGDLYFVLDLLPERLRTCVDDCQLGLGFLNCALKTPTGK